MLVLNRAGLALILTAVITSAAAAQTASGAIQGTVVDGSGSVLPGVTVTITNTATASIRETLTDDRGFFAVPALPAGRYEVQASANGYATRRQSALPLNVGDVVTLRVELGVALSPETIMMAGTAPMIEVTRSQGGSGISSTEVEHLPVPGRNAVGLSLFAPGVALDSTGGITIAGPSAAFSRVVVDGIERSRPFGAPYWVSQEATHGVEVSTSAHPAEYGPTAGGVVHLATKSGSNDLSGSAFAFHGRGPSDLGTNQFGGSLGGPLAPDRHFVYAIYDGLRPSDSSEATGWHSLDRDVLLGRTDHQLDPHRLTLRYNSERWQAGGNEVAAAEMSTDMLTANGTTVIGAALFNEARIHIGSDRDFVPAIGVAEARRIHAADTLTWIRGPHTVKSGVEVQFDRMGSVIGDGGVQEVFDRHNLGEIALFAQDEWRASNELTVTAGLRYDAQTFTPGENGPPQAGTPQAGTTARRDSDNIGPRVGAVWAPGAGTFALRGGYGVLYGRTPWMLLTAANADATRGIRPLTFGATYENVRVQQASSGFEWEWMPNTTLSANYILMRADRLPRAAGSSAGPLDFARGRSVVLESTGQSTAHVVTTELMRRFAQSHQYRVSYTLGSGGDGDPETAGSRARRQRLAGSIAVSSNRVIDRFDGVMAAIVRDWMLSGTYAAQTNPTRNGERLPAWISLDARIARDIPIARAARVTLLWEAFNLLDRTNRIALEDFFLGGLVTQQWEMPTHGQGLEYFQPRVMRVAARLSF